MTQPNSNMSLKGICDWAEALVSGDGGKRQNPPGNQNINADMVDGMHYTDLKADWEAYADSVGGSSGTAGGDLSGTYPDPTVAKIQGIPVSTTAPTNGQVLKYNSTSGKWEPGTDVSGSGGVAVGSQTWSTTGSYSWICPAGVTSVSVIVVGGGGSGAAGGGSRSGGGGGGGGYYKSLSVPVVPGTSYPVAVGAGGAGWSNAQYYRAGNAGGMSYFSFDGGNAIAGGGSGGSPEGSDVSGGYGGGALGGSGGTGGQTGGSGFTGGGGSAAGSGGLASAQYGGNGGGHGADGGSYGGGGGGTSGTGVTYLTTGSGGSGFVAITWGG